MATFPRRLDSRPQFAQWQGGQANAVEAPDRHAGAHGAQAHHRTPLDIVMSSTLKSLRALGDPTRLRIMALLERDELSVNELQEITRLGQSRISTHLGLLGDAELVQSRREGKRTFYRWSQELDAAAQECVKLAVRGARELPEHSADVVNLKR